MSPSFGLTLAKDEAPVQETRQRTNKILGL
jgi:hypothetical protein